MIKKGYSLIKDTLSKLRANQPTNLVVVLFIDQTTIYRPTRYTPFYIVYKQEPILSIELYFLIQRTLFIEEITNRLKLIKIQTRQFQIQEEDIKEAIYYKTYY